MVRLLLRVSILVAPVLNWASSVHAQSDPGSEQRLIREIRIEIAPIYSEEQAKGSSWKSFTNRHHIQTRESVIRTALLFSEGEVLDKELLEATERTLRNFKFVNSSELSVVPVDDQTVDVEVRTKEAWTLEPGMNIDGGGGLATISAHLIDFNLLGYGKKLFAEAVHELDVGTTWKFGYSDYQLFNSRWIGTAKYQTGPLIESYFAQARLPLYSPDSTWSYGGSAYHADAIMRQFEEGEESNRFAKDHIAVSSFVKRSFGQRYQKTNLDIRLNYKKVDYTSLGSETTTAPPPDQENLTPTIGLSTGKSSWAKNSFIDKMGVTEDDWLGHRYGGNVGYGIPLGDSLALWDVRVYAVKSAALSNQQLLTLNAAVDSEVVRNTIVRVGAKYYKKFSRHTLAMRFQSNIGYELDSSRQLQLGADSGLRGYPAREFTGEKSILMNLEDRQFWGSTSMGPKFAFATVLFLDAGNVWKEDEDIDLKDLNWSAGIGFRIGLSNMPDQPIMRADIGWPIGGGGYALTIGAEQHF